MADNPLWHETLHDHFGQYFSVDNVLYHEKTDHQDLIIFDNRAFGRVMALDGVVQTTERDEFIYHEMMTHVPLLAQFVKCFSGVCKAVHTRKFWSCDLFAGRWIINITQGI